MPHSSNISPPTRGAAFNLASTLWKNPSGRKPDADLPYEFRYPPDTFNILEHYHSWPRGGTRSEAARATATSTRHALASSPAGYTAYSTNPS